VLAPLSEQPSRDDDRRVIPDADEARLPTHGRSGSLVKRGTALAYGIVGCATPRGRECEVIGSGGSPDPDGARSVEVALGSADSYTAQAIQLDEAGNEGRSTIMTFTLER
jgi:hypothetical protein